MGGVDVHDQLRLQRYSVQRSIKYRKYYKSLFLGLVDLGITNGFIVHRAYCKKLKIKPMTHVQYMCKLHEDLLALTTDDMYEDNTFQPGDEASADEEAGEEAGEEGSDSTGHVCTLKTPNGKRGATSTYFCDGCDFPGTSYLSMKPKWVVRDKMLSCWDVWHKEFKNGKAIPESLKDRIRVRAPMTSGSPGKSPTKRRRVDSE
ncbi:hypothetical protein F442_19353 [Phytophthora nicotianae P10297]|uniref:PiggyBac transposable element-derived protein domain-containing protein n=1 Tax=Phytophthora nicotianae P10297 TaxID=1317064 RepID=W2YAP8_PHYNI|nr:hypothetical protein F442_19353 [Phytophthora nicotianae P10297]